MDLPGDPEPLPPRAWLVVGLLWSVAALNYLDRVMIITMRGSIKLAIPMTEAQFGLLTTVFLVVYAVCSPLCGFLVDRIGQSRLIIASLFCWSVATWLTSWASTWGELLAVRAAMGVIEAGYFPAAGALIMDYHRTRTRSLANGIHLSGVMVGSGLGGLGGWLAESHGWTFAFSFFGIGGIAYAGLLACVLRDRPAAHRGAARVIAGPGLGVALRSLFSRGAFVLALLFWGLLALASWGISGWMPSYLGEHFHLAQGKAGLMATGYVSGASLFGMIVGGAWADRWSRTNRRGRILVGVIGVLVAVPGVLLVANTGILAVALAGLVIYGFTRPFPDANMMPVLCQITDARYRATGLGLLNGFATLIGGVTIYIGGAIRDAHLDVNAIFNSGAAGLLVCAAMLWVIQPRERAAQVTP